MVCHSTASQFVHETISVFNDKLLKNSIRFPVGEDPEIHVLVDFEQQASLPKGGGAIDGTCMPMKNLFVIKTATGVLMAISLFCCTLLLMLVDFFTYGSTGIPGSIGDAAVYNTSRLARIQRKMAEHTCWN